MKSFHALLINFASMFALFGMAIVQAENGNFVAVIIALLFAMIQIPFACMNYNLVQKYGVNYP